MRVQTLIHAGWVMPMAPKGAVLAQHSVLIDEGKVVAVVPTAETADVEAQTVYNLPNQIVLPGLINAHSHAPMNILRGMGADLPLMDWLTTKIWPAEGKLMSPEFCYEGSLLAGEEMLRSGITCTNDHYFFPIDVARGLNEAGMKCTVSAFFIGFPSAMAKDADGYYACAEEVLNHFQGHQKTRVSVAPHAPYTVDDATLIRCRDLADKYDTKLHMHVDETQNEIETSMKEYGMRPVERLQKLGFLSDRLVSVHTVHPDENEMQLLAKAGASVCHCPCSNLKLASGFSPIAHMMDLGINIAIGTDSVASNDKLDLLGETRLAAMLGKAVSGEPTSMKVEDLLYAATMGGAKAIGWDDRIGSLEAGKDADIIAIDLAGVNTVPVFDAHTQLLYSAGREDITHVWVDGELVVKKQQCVELRHLTNIKAHELAQKWHNKV